MYSDSTSTFDLCFPAAVPDTTSYAVQNLERRVEFLSGENQELRAKLMVTEQELTSASQAGF